MLAYSANIANGYQIKMNLQQKKYFLIEALTFCYIALAYLWADGFYAVERFNSIGLNVQGNFGLAEHIRQAVFIIEYCLAISAIFLASKVKNSWGVGTLLLLIGWFFTTIDLVTHSIYGRPADLANIAVLNASAANLSDAIQQYASFIFEATAKSGIIFLPLLVKQAFSKRNISAKIFLAPLIVMILIYIVIMVKRGAPALVGYPKGFSYAFGTVALKINNILSVQEKMDSVPSSAFHEIRHGIRNVIVIIDESVEYGAFNDQLGISDKSIINLGRSFSGGNCSAPSNYILRKGFWERSGTENINIKEVESLFSIAKRNGFATTYIDNQGVLKDQTIRNYISKEELQSIDNIIENEGPQYERDLLAVDQIINLVKTSGNFILINKNGAHFPYANTLIPSEVTTSNAENYAKSVKNNAIDFVTSLAAHLPSDTIAFYTSDHGQELNARGTHCNTGNNISTKEYTVPFLIITNNRNLQNTLSGNLEQLQNNLTHIEFSESVRNMLGEGIPKANSVFKYNPPKQPYCGLYGQPFGFFGVHPSCKPLIPHEINRP